MNKLGAQQAMKPQTATRSASALLLSATASFTVLVGGCAHRGPAADQSSLGSLAAVATADSIEALGESIEGPIRFLKLEPGQRGNRCMSRGRAQITGTISDADIKVIAGYARKVSGMPVLQVRGTLRRAVVTTGICGAHGHQGGTFHFEKRGAEWGEIKKGDWREGWVS